MTNNRFFSLLILLLVYSPTLMSGEPTIRDFALIATDGQFHQLSRYRDKKAVVIMAVDNVCKYSHIQQEDFAKLAEHWQQENIAFFAMDSGEAHKKTIPINQTQNDRTLSILRDSSQLVTEELQFQQVGDIVFIDPKTNNVIYRGALNSELNSAIKNILTKNGTATAEQNRSQTNTCQLSYLKTHSNLQATPNYTSDVAPIIKTYCKDCHRKGGAAPFAFDSKEMAVGWSPMMREVLMTKRMPPAQVDPTIGKFINKHAITDKALRTLVHWIDAGSPIAPADKNENDPLTATTAQPQSEWLLGEPDLEISISSNAIPATGVIDYINELIEVNFEQEKWVKAVQFLPGDRSVLHHLQVRIQPNLPNETELSPREIARQRRFLEGYAPGKEGAMIFPENTGVVIRPGDKLFFTMHYTANGKATVDASRMALYFYDKAPEHEYTTINSGNYNFTIPPQVRHFPMEFKHTLKKDIVLYAMRPHMHFRGRAMQFVVTYPNQQQETLLSVPNYSYAWQPSYKLESPTPIPAGSTISIQGHFDNSQHNLANPDPNIAVGYGLQSWDEMFIGYLSYREQ